MIRDRIENTGWMISSMAWLAYAYFKAGGYGAGPQAEDIATMIGVVFACPWASWPAFAVLPPPRRPPRWRPPSGDLWPLSGFSSAQSS